MPCECQFIYIEKMKKKNALYKNEFNGINLAVIRILDEKLASILKNYILDGDNIYEYAILHKNMNEFKNLNFKNLDSLIVKDFPEMYHFNKYLNGELEESVSLIPDDKIYIDNKKLKKSELSNLIFNHNKNLLIPGSSKYLVEKKKIIDWYSYNTPIMNNPIITPMTGTGLGENLAVAEIKYREWIIASSYLLNEYNIWKKAMTYAASAENKNNGFSSIEFKQAYTYIMGRQFFINGLSLDSFDKKNSYILDFTLNDVMYRELSEDFLYILLNLLLANKIIGNIGLENSLKNDNKFFDILKDIIKDHYDDAENKDGYSCLKNLRWYAVNNYSTEYKIKELAGYIETAP